MYSFFLSERGWNAALKGEKSWYRVAVQVSAAIAAYARISINRFKNWEGYEWAYSDTDSLF